MKIKRLLLVSLFMIIILAGCNTGKSLSSYDDLIKRLAIPNEITTGLELPTTDEKSGATLVWSSSDETVLTNDGYLFVQSEQKSITLTANITIEDSLKVKKYDITVLEETEDQFLYEWEYYSNTISRSINRDTKFYTRNYGDCSIEYVSLSPEILGSDGKVYQTTLDQQAVLQVTLTKGHLKKVYKVDVTVENFTDIQIVKMVSEYVEEQIELLQNGEIEDLPSTHPIYGSTINWHSEEVGFITLKGLVLKPIEVKDIIVKCEIISGEVNKNMSFEIKNYGGNTESEYLNKWLSQLIPTNIKGTQNFITAPAASGDQYLDYQIRTNVGGVLNLIDGSPIKINRSLFIDTSGNGPELKNTLFYGDGKSHYSRTPEELNAIYTEFGILGPNYVIPNEENILWIVVHETGMPQEGNTVEKLAQIQYNNAYTATSPREASWNYQVDAYGIYQSYDDNVMCWHAGGTYTNLPYGNTGSIGIEMCINIDGNYEGAMYNDAKLIAYLLDKYNLSIENVKRHYDFSLKECPSYMIRTNRWNEFLAKVNNELTAIRVLKNAEVKWTISEEDMAYFEVGDNNLYYNKAVTEETPIEITLEVTKGTYHFKETKTLVLLP